VEVLLLSLVLSEFTNPFWSDVSDRVESRARVRVWNGHIVNLKLRSLLIHRDGCSELSCCQFLPCGLELSSSILILRAKFTEFLEVL